MQKDSKFASKIQDEIAKKLKLGIHDMYKKINKELDSSKASDKEKEKALKKAAELEFRINKEIQQSILLTNKQLHQNKMNLANMENVKDTVDGIAEQIKNPTIAADKMLTSFGGMSKKLFDAKKEGGGLGSVLTEGLEKASGFAEILFSPEGLLIAGLAAAAAAAVVFFKLFMNHWDFLDKKVMPAYAELNKQLGSVRNGNERSKKSSYFNWYAV
jgi:hypothetical protein